MFKSVLALIRLILFFPILAFFIFLCFVVSIVPKDAFARRMWIRQMWCRTSCVLLGLRIRINDGIQPNNNAVIYISNHRTFLDPLIALSYFKALPLAKADVADIPIVGFGAKFTGILFVDRSSRNSRGDAKRDMLDTLRKGYSILLYPEGTTSTERYHLPFKRGGMQITENGFDIVPILLYYIDKEDHWIQESMYKQFVYTCGKLITDIHLVQGPAISTKTVDEATATAEMWYKKQIDRLDEALQ